jgi:hypothetical protein
MKLFVAIAILFSATAQAAPSQRELDRVLAGIERAPTAEEIRRFQPGADAALITYAGTPGVSRVRRMRAIGALRFVPSANARAFLDQLLADEGKARAGAEVLDVAAALAALVPYGRPVLGVELGYLTHPSADVRQAAATSLGQLRQPDARGAVQARLTIEKDAGVRTALERALAELDAAAR